jgi:glyceraldehyde 3-phosphate dehydrogenase
VTVPTSIGAAKALGLVTPELDRRLNGFAVRAPIPTGSIVDLTVEVERATTTAEINAAFAERATSGALAGILAYAKGSWCHPTSFNRLSPRSSTRR